MRILWIGKLKHCLRTSAMLRLGHTAFGAGTGLGSGLFWGPGTQVEVSQGALLVALLGPSSTGAFLPIPLPPEDSSFASNSSSCKRKNLIDVTHLFLHRFWLTFSLPFFGLEVTLYLITYNLLAGLGGHVVQRTVSPL